MSVSTVNNISVFEGPSALALRFVIFEVAVETCSVGVDPLAIHHLAFHEDASVLLSCFLKNVGTFTLLLAFDPVAAVEVCVFVSHDSLTMAKSILPIAVINTFVCVDLLADARLEVVFPTALIRH